MYRIIRKIQNKVSFYLLKFFSPSPHFFERHILVQFNNVLLQASIFMYSIFFPPSHLHLLFSHLHDLGFWNVSYLESQNHSIYASDLFGSLSVYFSFSWFFCFFSIIFLRYTNYIIFPVPLMITPFFQLCFPSLCTPFYTFH